MTADRRQTVERTPASLFMARRILFDPIINRILRRSTAPAHAAGRYTERQETATTGNADDDAALLDQIYLQKLATVVDEMTPGWLNIATEEMAPQSD